MSDLAQRGRLSGRAGRIARAKPRGDAEVLFRFAGTRLRQELMGHFALVEGVTIWRVDFTGVYQGKF